ncbi:translation termination factor GTPase eRF3 [Terramyces sp. JEL0728]|nr:translation termination factor GTPase eRF3 [Terramyces sp. JEL0728]
MADDELTKKTNDLDLNKPKAPKFSFKSSFNIGANEFVPSFNIGATEFVPSGLPAATTPAASAKLATKPAANTTKPAAKKEEPKKTAAPAPTPKVVDEPEEEISVDGIKENINILFMGHVDAGKSTMGGHILLLTGMVDKRTMEKYEQEAKELGRESWYLSWALDLNQEERDKGKTTEYGRGGFFTDKRRFTIIDAPGHRNFIPSMIEGAAQADVGILVISARKGEFETGFERDGQTREHALLAKTAGIKRLILVINKMDDPTVQWEQGRYDEIVKKMLPFLKGVGYPQTDIEILPISGFTGANMKDPVGDVCPWYTGPPLLTLLDNVPVERKYNGPLLMPIADKVKDMGMVALGKLESGHVKKGSSVLIMPNRKQSEVMAVFQDENEVSIAYNGDNVRLRLKNVDEEDLLPGFVLCGLKNPVHAVMQFEAQLQIVEYPSIMCAGYTCVMHCHTTREEVIISELLHKIDKKTKKKSKSPPKFMKQGDVAIVLIETTRLVCLETFDTHPQLGRFNLRDEGRTVAVGKITRLIEPTNN